MKIAIMLALLPSVALAVFSQGSLNYTRDAILQYSTSSFPTSEAFCKEFRSTCVNIAGSMGGHHQLDCVYSKQAGPKLHAFCGSLPKNPDGTWTNGGAIDDITEQAAKQTKNTKVIQPAMGKTACVKFQKKHKGISIVC